jgi:hypothetical protein
VDEYNEINMRHWEWKSPRFEQRTAGLFNSFRHSMRLAIPALLIALLSCCGIACRSTHDPIASWTPREGFEYLLVTRRFSLGGVGVDGRTSIGEYAFRAVLRARNPAGIYKLLLSPGAQATEEGKLYALCGLRATDRAMFHEQAAIIVTNNPQVTTQSGCIAGLEGAAEVVKRISNGVYDAYFKKR